MNARDCIIALEKARATLDEHYRACDAAFNGAHNEIGIEARKRIDQMIWLLNEIEKLLQAGEAAQMVQKEIGGLLVVDLLRAAPCLEDVPSDPPPRRHELNDDWTGHFAVHVTGNWRLVFKPNHDPVRYKADGGVDLRAITAVTLVAVKDYH